MSKTTKRTGQSTVLTDCNYIPWYWRVIIMLAFTLMLMLSSCTVTNPKAKIHVDGKYMIMDNYGRIYQTNKSLYDKAECRELNYNKYE